MAITEAQAQQLVIATVGDVDPLTGQPPDDPLDGILAANIAVLWDSYAAQETLVPGLQRLYTERHAYRLVLGVVRRQYDLKAGTADLKRSQQAKEIEAAMKALDDQITAVTRTYGVAVSGTITKTAPVMPCDGLRLPLYRDANDPALTGSPYRPALGPRRF